MGANAPGCKLATGLLEFLKASVERQAEDACVGKAEDLVAYCFEPQRLHVF